MKLRATIFLPLCIAAVAFALGGFFLSHSDEVDSRPEPIVSNAYPADEIGHVIPFVKRPKLSLASGQFSVRVRDGKFTVEANEAWRFEVLEALADSGDFELVDHLRAHPYVTLSLSDATIGQVLAETVRDAPYLIRFSASEHREAPVIDTLEIGKEERSYRRDRLDIASENSPANEKKVRDLEKNDDREHLSVAPRSEGERRLAMERREVRERRRHEENLADLENVDADTRARAASALDVDEPGDLAALGKLLGNDPDPAVRAEIAYDLGFGDPRNVVPILVSALDDPSFEVVATATDALGFLDDPSVAGDLNELLSSPSEQVRVAARGALDLLDYK